jgi:hypothetical protein
MKAKIVHHVPPSRLNKFYWGAGTTDCGKTDEQVMEHSSIMKYVTCKRCLKFNDIGK